MDRVLSIVNLRSKYTRALTCENFCQRARVKWQGRRGWWFRWVGAGGGSGGAYGREGGGHLPTGWSVHMHMHTIYNPNSQRATWQVWREGRYTPMGMVSILLIVTSASDTPAPAAARRNLIFSMCSHVDSKALSGLTGSKHAHAKHPLQSTS